MTFRTNQPIFPSWGKPDAFDSEVLAGFTYAVFGLPLQQPRNHTPLHPAFPPNSRETWLSMYCFQKTSQKAELWLLETFSHSANIYQAPTCGDMELGTNDTVGVKTDAVISQ